MKSITDILKKTFKPVTAMIVFKTDQHDYYLETRNIKEDGTLGVARPVSRSFINKMVTTFSNKEVKIPHGPIPHNMLYADTRFGTEKYIWWIPPGKHKLSFIQNIGIEDGMYNMPGCIFIADNKELRVYCFEGDTPQMDKKMLYGPFFNYYNDGSVCLGNAKVEWPEDITWKEIQEHYEKLFWNSTNSHTINNPMKKGENLVISIKNSRNRPYDTDLLNEYHQTPAEIIR